MSPALVWNNVVAYSLQVGLLVALAAFVPALLRLRLPRARLAYWHILLAACLLLPLVRPWRQAVADGNVLVTTTILAVGQPAAPSRFSLPLTEVALILLAAGAAARLVWLAAGFWKLHRYRRDSEALDADLPWSSRAEVRLAHGISSPVTFGLRRPVVLVPPRFPALPLDARKAILCHELLHVARRDWLFTVTEELIRAALWFHPAIWWLLGEIQLAREQAVDREVVRLTQAKDEYVDALLAIAAACPHAAPQPDLAPAPLFLRRRHLKQRVVSIFQEVRMSKTRLISALAAGLCILVAACWFVTGTFPLAAAPQFVSDAPGVSVDVGNAALLHRTGVAYPDAARNKGVQGIVTVEVRLDGTGNVADARVLSGPEELRNAVLQSVLQWHFAHDAAGSTRQVTVAFRAPEAGRVPTFNETARPMRPSLEGRTVKVLTVKGLSQTAQDELLSKLPVHEGDTLSQSLMTQVTQAVKSFDEHMTVFASPMGDHEAAIQILAPGAAGAPPGAPLPPSLIRVGGNVQSTKLVQQPRPVYPPEAKAQRIQGKVILQIVIGKDGTVQKIVDATGDPLLVPSAIEAVRQWVYQPTLLNGQPVDVQTQVDVNYTLSQ